MAVHLRPMFALLAVAVLNLGTIHSWGFYTRWAFLAAMASLVFGVLACEGRSKSYAIGRNSCWLPGPDRSEAESFFLLAVVTANSVAAMFCADLLYGDGPGQPFLQRVVMMGAGVTFLCILMAIIPTLGLVNPARSNGAWLGAVVVLAIGFEVRVFTILASPEPVIDVFNLLRDGSDHIIAGDNPYANDIVSPYGTLRAQHFGVLEPADPRPAGYPPLPLILGIAPRLLGWDVRWANVACDLFAALAIMVIGWRRNRRWHGVLAASLYLSAARVPFIVEQAWYEPMLAALFGLGLVFTEFEGGKRTLGYLLLGLGLTAKQFGLPLLLPLAIAHRQRWRLLLLGLAVGGLVMLPFFLWSPRDFLDIVLFKHLARPPQSHSITVGSFLFNEFGVTMPRFVGWGLAGLAMFAVGAITPRNTVATALGLGTALLAFCVFHTQGFPNYFYLVQYFWLLGFVGVLPRPGEEAASHVATRADA